MILGLLCAAVVATAIALRLSRTILEPIRARRTRCARWPAATWTKSCRSSPRRTRRDGRSVQHDGADDSRVSHGGGTACSCAQPTAQATIDSFPTPWWSWILAVVERANPAARRILGVAPIRYRRAVDAAGSVQAPSTKCSSGAMIRSPPAWTTPGASVTKEMSGFFCPACSPFAGKTACSARRSSCPT